MRGVAPRNQEDDELLYALSIIIGSGFGAVFAASYGIDRNVPARVLQEMPIPTNRHSIEILSDFGVAAKRLCHTWRD